MSAVSADRPVRGYIDGCFDIMHSGHYNAIRQAKNICDILVVGIHSDQEIAENKSMPVMRQEERYRLLDHIKWIDEILYDVPYSPEIATLERARADFCIHGDDMPVNSQGFCAYDEMRNAGRLRIIKRTEGVSTTDLIGRLLTLSRNQPSDLGGASPTMGLRMSADEVIEAAAAGDSNAVKLLRESVQQLVAKYHISSQDAAPLQDQIQTLETVLNQKPRDLRDMQDKGDESQSQGQGGYARTQVPVQLLASTRRIREFSSAKQPTSDDCVVYVSGSFDMFHVGHAEFLKDARELGTFLLVGIHDDASISKAKGQNLPVMNLNERVLNVCACKWVDEVIIGAPMSVTEDLVKTWDIHVVAKGSGHKCNAGEPKYDPRFEVPKKSGIFKELPSRWPDLCHDTVVERIIRGREEYLTRNKDRARREDTYYETKKISNSVAEA
ncbi:unnamed protein product [Cladocopium goreaui]|uniref:ethanolamine-phosphate cytidylyltransferase n=1 Tax=Cladocopium goreaui TaxID=2562237 RepID=A0A9P1D289_9DINO|nr:unnamed protein product [Cladocopium goreaui]